MAFRDGKETTNNSSADVQEAAPTTDQLGNILDYLGPSKAGTVVQDATGLSDALRKFKEKESSFQRPVVVDWNNGRAGKWILSLGQYNMMIPMDIRREYLDLGTSANVASSCGRRRERNHEARTDATKGNR